MEEVRILGHYRPSVFQAETIEAELRAFLPPCCRCERISVRYPNGTIPHPDNLEWHQDGMPAKHMVIWASEQPTELRLSDGTLITPNPFDVVWFDNEHAWHKQPQGTRPSDRWFVSVRCSGAIF